jgi:signal peptidase
LLASFLSYLGGPVLSIAYRAVILLFEWLSPALPDLQWTLTAFLGTLVPAFGLIVIRNQVMPVVREDVSHVRGGEVATSWVMIAALAAGLIWFNTGLFGYQPTLVSGVSMNPTLLVGDVVITKDVGPEEIAVGDIIRFRLGGDFIIHRVIDIERNETGTFIVTQGDGNNVEDPPFTAQALEGKVIATIPKIGWVSIGVRSLLNAVP